VTIGNNNLKRRRENAMPVTDEGWWQSVLAEEWQHTPRPQHHTAPKPKPAPEPVTDSEKVVALHADWNAVQDLYRNDRIVAVKVTSHNRGGLLVEGDGFSGFIPFSHLIGLVGKDHESDREVSLEPYLGRTLNVKVIECVPEDGRVVFSERAALAESGRRAELFHSLQVGAHVKGIVTNITDFGVFVDLGGVEGLIHISELSWGRVSHPNQVVELGGEIEVQVMEISAERCRVALSLKRLLQNPWERAHADFPEGTIQAAIVTSVLSYGAFARLELGVEGLIHISEIPLEMNQIPRDVLAENQQIQVRVLHVDPIHQRLGLSLRLEQ
jgi:small subunit ribosomal protein S1